MISPTPTFTRPLPCALARQDTDLAAATISIGPTCSRPYWQKARALLLWILATGLSDHQLLAEKGVGSTVDAGRLAAPLTKEPTYLSAPKYCLIDLGTSGPVKVWLVEDGRRLFVDKNANGDLTDDGPPIEPSKLRQVDPRNWDYNYLLDAIAPTDGSRHTNFDLRRWNYNEKEDSYGLSLSVDGALPVYAGWFGTFWSEKRETVPIVHFGRTFTPKLLRTKEFTVGARQERLSLGFMNPGSGPGAESRLSIDALPRSVAPKVHIEWPVAEGSATVRTSHELSERCCYWEFYTTKFTVPKGVAAGNAKISVELAGAEQIKLTTTNFETPVLAPEVAAER